MSKSKKVNTKFLRMAAVAIMAVGILFMLMPFLPAIQFKIWHKNFVPYSGNLNSYFPSSKKGTKPIPKDNRLVIPEIGVDESILEGKDISVLNHNGVWRLPYTSNDPAKSNMVIIGHRYLYNNPFGAFYHLDQLKSGEKFALYWQGKEHIYTIDSVKTVAPSEVSVEAPSKEPRLTLYTCTPLWSATHRLVVVAKEV